VTNPGAVKRGKSKIEMAVDKVSAWLGFQPMIVAPASTTVEVAWEEVKVAVWTAPYDLLWTALSIDENV
jgi:hypothetical protein